MPKGAYPAPGGPGLMRTCHADERHVSPAHYLCKGGRKWLPSVLEKRPEIALTVDRPRVQYADIEPSFVIFSGHK